MPLSGVRPPQNVPCPVCSGVDPDTGLASIRYLDDHTQEELEACERVFQASRSNQERNRGYRL